MVPAHRETVMRPRYTAAALQRPPPSAAVDTMPVEVPYPMTSGGEPTITWYGHACVEMVTPGGVVVLFDPWCENPKSPRRADSVGRCDVMLVSHGPSDHLG